MMETGKRYVYDEALAVETGKENGDIDKAVCVVLSFVHS